MWNFSSGSEACLFAIYCNGVTEFMAFDQAAPNGYSAPQQTGKHAPNKREKICWHGVGKVCTIDKTSNRNMLYSDEIKCILSSVQKK